VQGPAKLHGLRRGLFGDGTVCAAPSVVIDEPGAAASLWNAADGAEPQVGKVLSKAPREQADVAEGNLFGKFAADVVGGEGGRAVAAVRKGGLQVLGRGVRHELHGCAPGTKRVVKSGRGVHTRRQGSKFVAPARCPTDIRE
jgi:hypothetical protein